MYIYIYVHISFINSYITYTRSTPKKIMKILEKKMHEIAGEFIDAADVDTEPDEATNDLSVASSSSGKRVKLETSNAEQ